MLRNLLILNVVSLLGLGCGSTSTGQENVDEPIDVLSASDSAGAAAAGMRMLAQLVESGKIATLGLETVDQVNSSPLGVSFAVHSVRLDRLQGYQESSAPHDLFEASVRSLYPVVLSEEVRSSVGVVKLKEKWEASEFGNVGYIQSVSKLRRENAAEAEVPLKSYFIVDIPALNLAFVARRTEDDSILIPIVDYPPLGLKAGAQSSARQLFPRLAEFAKELEDLPR